MQSDRNFYIGNIMLPVSYEVVGENTYISATSALHATITVPKLRGPFHGFILEPSEMCPENFIIFDQTDNKSRIMTHPALAHKFNYPGFDPHGTCAQENGNGSSSLKEDTEVIDSLLNVEEEGREDEEVSTGRTMGSPNSHLMRSCRPQKMRCPSIQSHLCSNSNTDSYKRKQLRKKKMLTMLRGIVPGGDEMDTATVLDEAVKCLKSLKVEVKKLGIGSF